MKEWKNTEHSCHYYFNSADGKIVAQVHNVAMSKIWVAKIILAYNEDKYLGTYISEEFARSAVEKHFEREDNTIENSSYDSLPLPLD